MYVISSGACSEPNSATPMSQADIDAQDAQISAVGSDFDNGNATLDSLIRSLGGNPVSAVAGNAGIATVGAPVPVAQVVSPANGGTLSPSSTTGVAPGSAAGSAGDSRRRINDRNARLFGGGVEGGGTPLGVPEALAAAARQRRAGGSGLTCSLPQVFPLVTVFPVPAVMPSASVTPAASPKPMSVAAPAAAPAPAPSTRPIPSTGNVCVDLVLGLVTKDQVSEAQQAYCSANGYQGAHFPPTWIQIQQINQKVAGTLPMVPYQTPPPNTDPQGYPAEYNAFETSLLNGGSGVSGLGCGECDSTSTVLTALAVALSAAALVYLMFDRSKTR